MKQATLNETAFYGESARRNFPFSFRSEPRIGPARVCISFIVAYMADRLGFVHRTQSAYRHHPPLPIAFFPVQGSVPFFFLDRSPAVREPEQRVLIPSILYKFQVLAVGG